MILHKHFICTSIAFFILVITSTADAKIQVTAFKNITNYFLKGKEYCSPTIGIAALEAGVVVENIRFFGPYKPGIDNDGRRVYHNDESVDPLWNVVKIFFPSTGGMLSVDTIANTNIGRYAVGEIGISFIVGLIEFAYYARLGDNSMMSNAGANLIEISEKFVEKGTNLENRKDIKKTKKDLIEKSLQPLLQNVYDAIKNEQDSIFPKYSTEQIILAFFVYKFDRQVDIWNLIRKLDEKLPNKVVDHNKIKELPQNDDLITQ